MTDFFFYLNLKLIIRHMSDCYCFALFEGSVIIMCYILSLHSLSTHTIAHIMALPENHFTLFYLTFFTFQVHRVPSKF